MKILFIINDPPYGTERTYNALRLAHALLKKESHAGVVVFLFADAVIAACAGHKTTDGYYKIEWMLKRILSKTASMWHLHGCTRPRRFSPRGRRSPHYNE
jgi:uncharacterized protein involved in oxidation of intracellular sulfur